MSFNIFSPQNYYLNLFSIIFSLKFLISYFFIIFQLIIFFSKDL